MLAEKEKLISSLRSKREGPDGDNDLEQDEEVQAELQQAL